MDSGYNTHFNFNKTWQCGRMPAPWLLWVIYSTELFSPYFLWEISYHHFNHTTKSRVSSHVFISKQLSKDLIGNLVCGLCVWIDTFKKRKKEIVISSSISILCISLRYVWVSMFIDKDSRVLEIYQFGGFWFYEWYCQLWRWWFWEVNY